MAELKWNVNKVSLRKVFALLLAMCVCISSMGMDASAAGAAKEGSDARATTGGSPVTATDVTITLQKTAEVEEGKTITLQATVTVSPTDATKPEIKWSSDNSAIARVDVKTGVVTGVKAGTAKITATAGGTSEICTVTVKKKQTGEQKPASVVTRVTLNPTSLTMKVGEEKTITPNVEVSQGTGTPDKTVTWASSDPTVAAVAGGKVTAKKAGKATITATANNGKQGTCTVTVNPAPNPTTNVAVESITLSRDRVSINKGNTYTLKATINPSSATDKTLNWTSSNRRIATVDKNGKVKAVAKGTATITVTSKNGKKATCKVTVKVPAKSVSVSTTKLYIAKGKKASFRASAGPADTTDSIQVKASNKNVTVKLNKKTGEVTVTAKKAGTAKITVSAGSKKKTVNVTVAKKATKAKSVKLNKKKATLNIGKTLDLKATMNPSKSTDTLKWTTSNKKVAMVDKFGRVTARKQGTATITVKTSSGKKATCKITVPSGVKLKKTSATIKLRKSTKIQIKSTVVKGDKVKSYKSSNTKVAKVDKSGKVTGVKKGKATITVTMKSGSTATFKVTVK